jgi:AcrR family transcriptional regulator
VSTRHRTASTEIEGRILAAALRILDDQGEHALTVRGIATAAGIAPMGIYSRFEGKSGIYEALWIEGFDRLSAEMARATESDDALADLYDCGQHYRRFAVENPAHYRLLFVRVRSDFVPSPEAAAASGRTLARLITLIERAQREGLMPPGPSIDLAQAFWSTVHGFVALELSDLVFATNAETAFDMVLRALLDGLRPRARS